ncbi:MAG: hypothetical protein WBY75_09675 [Terracidiphilus sp.]
MALISKRVFGDDAPNQVLFGWERYDWERVARPGQPVRLPKKLSSPKQHAESHPQAQARGDELKSVRPMKIVKARVIQAIQKSEPSE